MNDILRFFPEPGLLPSELTLSGVTSLLEPTDEEDVAKCVVRLGKLSLSGDSERPLSSSLKLCEVFFGLTCEALGGFLVELDSHFSPDKPLTDIKELLEGMALVLDDFPESPVLLLFFNGPTSTSLSSTSSSSIILSTELFPKCLDGDFLEEEEVFFSFLFPFLLPLSLPSLTATFSSIKPHPS